MSGVLHRVRAEWAATAYGLLVGITMVYVPYEFGAKPFQFIYPHIRLLGSAFLVGSAILISTLLYPAWPALIRWLGRVLLVTAFAWYWWFGSVRAGGLTGVLLYPLLVAALSAETLPALRGQGLFSWFLAAIALSFGGLMVVDPSEFAPILYGMLRPALGLVGLLYLGAGMLLVFGLVRQRPGSCRVALAVIGGLFVHMAFVLTTVSAWTGVELYSLLAAGCFCTLALRRLPQPTGVRWRLFRGMALASVLPVLAVGALASVLAQNAMERELRGKALDTMSSEVAWLEQVAEMAHSMVNAQAQDPSFLASVRARDVSALQARINLLEKQSGQFDGAWLLDDTGTPLVVSTQLGQIHGNYSQRDYFEQVQREHLPYLSRPFMGAIGTPFVAFTAPVELGEGRVGVLAGGVSLLRLRIQRTIASRSYDVELFDQRDGLLLHGTEKATVLSRAPVLDLAGAQAFSNPEGPEGMFESLDPSGRRLLIAHGQVPGTPWTVAVTVRLRETFAPLTRLSVLVVGIALGAGAIALLLSRWAGRDVAYRLEALRDGFAALGTLPLDRPVPARGDDEVSQLTSGFNEMAARIEHTQQELREAVMLRDQFLSMASHELRTPLTPLKATVELLLRQPQGPPDADSDKRRAMLERLQRQVDRITRLVGDMLDVARLQAGRLTMKRTDVDLIPLAREVVDRIQHSRPERTAAVHLELPEGPLVGQWDEQRLDQLLTNLVENAVRYSPPEAPIHVRLQAEPDEVLIEVVDQGIGISAESLPHLFSPYYRAQNAAVHYAGGLGLGLAISREIVERHGGRLWATSEGPGQGSRFCVRLPRREA